MPSTSVAAARATQPFIEARRRLALRLLRSRASRSSLTAGPIFSVQQVFALLLETACADFEILQDFLGEEMQIGRDPAQNEGEVMTLIVSQVFAILADAKPKLAFEAKNMTEARELCKERWLRADLSSQKSDGIPLCDVDSKLSVRRANAEEATLFDQAAGASTPSDDLVLAYLVELDG
jgi:hypothetical protein